MWTGVVTVAMLALVLVPAGAHAARVTIGSDLSAPATAARSDPNDVVFWPAALRSGGAIDVPVAGQAIIMRLKGGTQQPQGAPKDPAADIMHFVVLRPQLDGTWRTTATSVEHRAPVIGRGADENTISTFTSVNPLCVQPGDRIGLAEVGGFDPSLFPDGLPYQVFGAVPGSATNEFRAGGAIDEGRTVVRGMRVEDTELLLQVVIGTGSSARPTCGGTAPSGSDPGLLPEPPDPTPDPTPTPAPGVARAFVLKPKRAPKLRHGKVKLPIRCAATASCSGALELRARGKRIGRSRYKLAAGATGTVRVKLTRAARRLVRRSGRLRVSARVTAGGQRSSRVLTIRA
jgi:hypothetical protein